MNDSEKPIGPKDEWTFDLETDESDIQDDMAKKKKKRRFVATGRPKKLALDHDKVLQRGSTRKIALQSS